MSESSAEFDKEKGHLTHGEVATRLKETKAKPLSGYALHSKYQVIYTWLGLIFIVCGSLSLFKVLEPTYNLIASLVFVIFSALITDPSLKLWVPNPASPPAEEKLKEIASMKEDMKTL